jgi:hypothetical protein
MRQLAVVTECLSELIEVRGSQQVKETAADSLGFLLHPFIPILVPSLTAGASRCVKESRCIGLPWWDCTLCPQLSVLWLLYHFAPTSTLSLSN